jgi:hypothetical protein
MVGRSLLLHLLSASIIGSLKAFHDQETGLLISFIHPLKRRCNLIKKIWPATLLILLVAVSSTAYSAEKLRVLNPTPPNRMVDRVPLTPRLDSLEGKTLFLVDIGWGGPQAAPSIYAEMKAWFAQNMPSVKVEIRSIKGSYMQDQPELWKEISEKGHAAMVGISG